MNLFNRAPMPISKHRRKGKLRTRDRIGKAGNPLLPQPVTDPEYDDPEYDALLMARLRKMYGGNDWPDWTDAQIDAAMVEIAHEQVEARIKRLAAVAEREWRAQRREQQQPELVPINSLAETG